MKKRVEESKALKAEKVMKSEWYILDSSGELQDVGEFDYSKYPNLKKFAYYEKAKKREAKQEPPHIKYMREQEIADYEPGSDPGNLRFYPKGKLIKSLLEEYVSDKMNEYGAMEIESPIMYDFEHPSMKDYIDRFPARQYVIESPNKRLFLRFAACFGQFLMASNMVISYKNLPLRLYEMSRYSFRVEQRGELCGLKRLRAFSMPDCHAFCADLEQAKQEMLLRFDLSYNILKNIGFDLPAGLEMGVRFSRDFWEENKKFVVNIVKKWGKPVLIEMWPEKFFYFIMKYELNFVDALDKAAALSTDQIDVENAKRYKINYVDKDGKKKAPLILHLSPSGAIERVIYALLERAYLDSKSKKPPMLPLWLAPSQVRLIPISDKQLSYCKELVKKFNNVRVDIDDRNEQLSKKIRDAERRWIPYIAVIGEKEVKSGKLSVRVRSSGEQKQLGVAGLVSIIKDQVKDMPFKPLPLPKLLSKRPIFVG